MAARMASAEAIIVREKHLSLGKLLAHVVHARDVAVVDCVDRRNAGSDGLLGEARSGVRRAVDDALPHGGESVVWHKRLWVMLKEARGLGL